MKEDRRGFSPSFTIIIRILKVLHDNEPLTKTLLAQKSGINYSRLLKHLDWLEERHIVELAVHRHKVIVKLTRTGREFGKIILSTNNG